MKYMNEDKPYEADKPCLPCTSFQTGTCTIWKTCPIRNGTANNEKSIEGSVNTNKV